MVPVLFTKFSNYVIPEKILKIKKKNQKNPTNPFSNNLQNGDIELVCVTWALYS